MPDWSYRTVFQPLLLQLPPTVARDLCLGCLGTLSRLPLGSAVIDFLGHMRPDSRLRTEVAGMPLPSPVVLGPLLDTNLLATAALSRFGIGMIEVGPIRLEPPAQGTAIRLMVQTQSLLVSGPLPTVSATQALQRLPADVRVPILARLQFLTPISDAAPCLDEATSQFIRRASAVGIGLDAEIASTCSVESWRQLVRGLVQVVATDGARRLLVYIPADIDLGIAGEHLTAAIAAGTAGVIVEGRIRDAENGWLIGRAALVASLNAVTQVRTAFGPQLSIVAGGADDPQSALALLAAGATAVQIDAGLAYSGPGLTKRINEAVLFARSQTQRNAFEPIADLPHVSASQAAADHFAPEHAAAMSWFWALALGIAMVLGGCLALVFAATRVLLPYDEAYLAMTAGELSARLPQLLHFMAHDRVTLAGTMLAVGIQYVFLAWFGIRRGTHWAKATVVTSALAGFLSFFLFLGFGYFDPLHAFVTAILFQFLLLAFQGRLSEPALPALPNLENDWRWRLANWGQLLLVAQGVAIIVAGVTIAKIGITTVFVPEDLEFLGTTVEAIAAANPRLVPVVAHDRASFGGMLISVGLATLLPALWGIRQGETWLWWMLALAGTAGYTATLLVHAGVGYLDPLHLAPAVGGLIALWAALSLLWPYLATPSLAHEDQWRELLAQWKRRPI